MPSSVSQYVINMALSLPVRRDPVVLMNISGRRILLLTSTVFDVTHFTILTPLLLLSSYRFSFPIVGVKIFFVPTFALKSPKRIFMQNLRK